MMSVSSRRWAARGLHAGITCRIVLLVFCVITPFALVSYAALPRHAPTDFFAFYSFSCFIRTHAPALIYDDHLLNAVQIALHGKPFPYLYPPDMLLLVWPLAYLPFGTGWVLWVAAGLLATLAATGFAKRNDAALLACLVAPSTLWVAWCGQSTLLAAALLFGGFRMLQRRPWLAGVLFGLLAYKPQLGILVPVALVSAGQWRTIAAAGATMALLVLASAAAFGWPVWLAWVQHLPSIGDFIAGWTIDCAPLMATVTSNLLLCGLTMHQAHLVQIATSFGAVAIVWCCFRRRTDMLGAALVASATFLTTPYAFGYDLPVLTAAIIVVAQERWQRDDVFAFGEIIILVAGFLLPFCVISVAFFRFGSVVVLGLVWVVAHRIATRDRSSLRPAASQDAVMA